MTQKRKKMSNDLVVALVLIAAMVVVILIAVIVSDQREHITIDDPGGAPASGKPAATFAPKNLTKATVGNQTLPAGAAAPSLQGTPLPVETRNEVPQKGFPFGTLIIGMLGAGALGMGGLVLYRRVARKPQVAASQPEPPTGRLKASIPAAPLESAVYAPPGSIAARHLARRKIAVTQSKRQLLVLRLKRAWKNLVQRPGKA